MDKVEIEFDLCEMKMMGELISSLSAPQNDGAAVKFEITRNLRKFLVTIFPTAY